MREKTTSEVHIVMAFFCRVTFCSFCVRLVERSAVNRNVVGSSPTGGASLRKETQTEHRASGVPIVGVDGGGGTPVPIPNTAVKPTCVENTWLEAARENRQMPTLQAPEVVLLPGLVSYTEKRPQGCIEVFIRKKRRTVPKIVRLFFMRKKQKEVGHAN